MPRRPKAAPEPAEEPRSVVVYAPTTEARGTAVPPTVVIGGTVTGATGPASGGVPEYVGPTAGALVGATVSEATRRLAVMHSTVAMETDLARLNLFVPPSVSSTGLQLALPWLGTLYGHPVRILETRGRLNISDMRLLAHAIKRYAEQGCPEDRRVHFTLNEASRWSGHKGKGGRQVQLVRDSLLRMQSTGIESVRRRDGHIESMTWDLIHRSWTADAVGTGGGFVTFSDELAWSVRGGYLTYLYAPMLDALADLDEYAARLWVFLESERIDGARRWSRSLFSAPEGMPAKQRDTPAIADLLRLSTWGRRRSAKERIDRAMQNVRSLDRRYSYRLVPGAKKGERGMWTLTVEKKSGNPSLPRGLASERNRLVSPPDAGTRRGASPQKRVLRDPIEPETNPET